jgi:hypothetical protein
VHIEHGLAVNIYTPQIQAQTVAIGDAPRDALVGFDTSGAMCIRANRGAVRVEQQLTGQSILIPQAGDVLLLNGQFDSLRTSAGHCACDSQTAKRSPPPQPTTVETPIAKEEPVYQVFMPPLIYDANAKVQPEIDPKLIVLVRRVRVRPTLIFQGRVEGETVAAVTPAPPATAPAASSSAPRPAAPGSDSFVDRVRNFVRRLWPSSS